jgi:hypothetical protein
MSDLVINGVNIQVTGIQGQPLSTTAPISNQSLFYNIAGSGNWRPQYANGPVYNVLDYGLLGDNNTPNDTAIQSLNSIVSALNIPGVIIYFPIGNYIFNNTIATFPFGTTFRGVQSSKASNNNFSSTLKFNGVGIFFQGNYAQTFENLSFQAITNNSYTSVPDQANQITNCSNFGGRIMITTATPHGYLNNDVINVYGVNGLTTNYQLNVGANSDPASPWIITVVDTHNFTLNGSNFSGTYTSTNTSISSITGTSTVTVTTSSPHGLVNDQLVYINPATTNSYVISGVPNNNFNGLYRITVTGTNTFTLYFSNPYYPVTGSGTYSSGASVHTGGVCCSNSHVPLIGLNLQSPGPTNGPAFVTIRNCSFGGFKYQISNDGGELVWIEKCNFDYVTELGYGPACLNDNRSHSSCGIRVGSFLNDNGTPGSINQIANVMTVDQCQFLAQMVGIYHHDGLSHTVTRCNYEQDVVAIIGVNCINVKYDSFENDGSNKDIIWIYSDTTSEGSSYNLSVTNVFATGTSGLVATPPSLNGQLNSIQGFTFKGNYWDEASPPIKTYNNGIRWSGPLDISGNWTQSNKISDFSIYGSNSYPISGVYGTLINHPGDAPIAALDVMTFYQISNATLPYMIVSIPLGGGVNALMQQIGAPEVIDGQTVGPKNDFINLYNASNFESIGARFGQRYAYVNIGNITNQIIGAFTPFSNKSVGAAINLTMRVTAYLYNDPGYQATWEIKQQVSQNVSNTISLVGSQFIIHAQDLGGGFTPPTIVISNNQIACQISGFSLGVSVWAIKFDYECVSY